MTTYTEASPVTTASRSFLPGVKRSATDVGIPGKPKTVAVDAKLPSFCLMKTASRPPLAARR